MKKETAIVLTEGLLDTAFAKTCHGLLRGSDRFDVVAVVDAKFAHQDAGQVMDGKPLGISIFATVKGALTTIKTEPGFCIVGIATPGGYLPEAMKNHLIDAMDHGLHVVSGLHVFLSDDKTLSRIAEKNNVRILDVRKPPSREKLNFWSGKINLVKTPKIGVFGMDCAVGKRTTCRFLLEACRQDGIKTEMIYTGQTGWMQGYPYGFIFDTMINDFISGEIERVLFNCYEQSNPELMLIEGQSSLRNPSGPCGTEFIFSGNVDAIILQHVPGRKYFEDTIMPLPTVESEVELYKELGVKVLAITINEENMDKADVLSYQDKLESSLHIPIVRPLNEGVAGLVPTIRAFINSKNNQ